jgi:hypothetical protein
MKKFKMYIPNEIIEEILNYIEVKYCFLIKLVNKNFKSISDYVHDPSELFDDIVLSDNVIKYESLTDTLNDRSIKMKILMKYKCYNIFRYHLDFHNYSKEKLTKIYDKLYFGENKFIKHLLEHIDQRHDIVNFSIYDDFLIASSLKTDLLYINFKKGYKKYSKQSHDLLTLYFIFEHMIMSNSDNSNFHYAHMYEIKRIFYHETKR